MSLKTCTRPAGSVAAYGKVEIRLSQDTVITASGLNYLAVPIEVTAAADGSVSVQLQATNDLTPNNTYYTVTEYAGVTDSTYYVQVPQTAGPFVLTAIQVSVPPAPAPVGAAHVASLLVDGAATVGGALEALSSTSIDMLGTNQTITGVKSIVTSNGGGLILTYDGGALGQALLVTSNRTDGTVGHAKPGLAVNLSSLAQFYDAGHDFNAGISVQDYCANGTGIIIGEHGAGDGIYAQTDDNSITNSATPPNAINIFAGAGTANAQATDSNSGGTVTYGATTLTDTAKSWTLNQWADNGAGIGRWVLVGTSRMLVTSNSATVLTGTGGWVTSNGNLEQIAASTPANGTAYAIPQANGAAINIQRYGSGNAIRITGQANSGSTVGNAGANTDLVRISQNTDTRSISILTDTSATASTIALVPTGKTSGIVFQVFHATSTMTGDVVNANMAVGSGAFTGKFLNFSVNSVAKFSVDSTGAALAAASMTFSAATTGISNTGGDIVVNAKATSNMLFQVGGSTQAFMGNNGILKVVNNGGLDASAGAQTVNVGTVNANVLNLGNATALVNLNYAVTALGGGAAPTVGTIGGSGPATAGQNSWLKVNINGTASYIPVWR